MEGGHPAVSCCAVHAAARRVHRHRLEQHHVPFLHEPAKFLVFDATLLVFNTIFLVSFKTFILLTLP